MLQIKSQRPTFQAEQPELREIPIARVHVCMHVLGSFRNDVRAKRAALALHEAGLHISVLDIESEPADCRDALHRGHPVTHEDIDGIHVRHMPVHRSFTTTRFKRWALARAAWMFLRSAARLVRTPADAYHALDLPALPACYIAARVRRKPIIFDSYELPLSTLAKEEIRGSRKLLQRIMAPLLKHMLPRCAAVIAVSPPIAREIARRYPRARVSVVRNILPYTPVKRSNRLREHLGLPSSTRIALYQGYLQADRGLDRLVQAARYLEPDIGIVIMGKAKDQTQAQLEALIASEGVSNRVKILPPAPYDELLIWTSSADVGLLLYSPEYSLNVRMCLPNKLFEFLMAGLPVLSTRLVAVAEIIDTRQVGKIVNALEPEAIGKAINAILRDPDALAQMRKNALQAAREEFYWEKEQQNLLNLYENIFAQ
jgi:glycosyltransferase involved in cell wall biosynthesis